MGVKYIYGLRQVGDWEFRYIGQTGNPKQRKWSHARKGIRPDSRTAWVNHVIDSGGEVELVVLARIEAEEADLMEARTITYLRSVGHRLTNERRPLIPKERRLEMMKAMLAERPPDQF